MDVVPLPATLSKHDVASAFITTGKRHEMDAFRTLTSTQDLVATQQSESNTGSNHYFSVEFYAFDNAPGSTPSSPLVMYHPVSGRTYSQFGRTVVAELLNTPERVDWQYCVTDETTESAAALSFKTRFSVFDASLVS